MGRLALEPFSREVAHILQHRYYSRDTLSTISRYFLPLRYWHYLISTPVTLVKVSVEFFFFFFEFFGSFRCCWHPVRITWRSWRATTVASAAEMRRIWKSWGHWKVQNRRYGCTSACAWWKQSLRTTRKLNAGTVQPLWSTVATLLTWWRTWPSGTKIELPMKSCTVKQESLGDVRIRVMCRARSCPLT